jgi:hypothetical protein
VVCHSSQVTATIDYGAHPPASKLSSVCFLALKITLCTISRLIIPEKGIQLMRMPPAHLRLAPICTRNHTVTTASLCSKLSYHSHALRSPQPAVFSVSLNLDCSLSEVGNSFLPWQANSTHSAHWETELGALRSFVARRYLKARPPHAGRVRRRLNPATDGHCSARCVRVLIMIISRSHRCQTTPELT